MQAEEVAVVAARAEVAVALVEAIASLLPDEERRRARAVFPAEDGVEVELLEVELAGIGLDDRRSRILVVVGKEWLVTVHVSFRARISELAPVGVVAGRDVRLRIELERQRRRRSEVHARVKAHSRLLEAREGVVCGVVPRVAVVRIPLIVIALVLHVESNGGREAARCAKLCARL